MPVLVVMVEEESMCALLDIVLPMLMPEGWYHKVIPHQGWSDLENSIQRKLRAWREPDACFIVMRDNDRGDCRQRKTRLLDRVSGTGRETQTKARIVCEELESWVLGDLTALEAALGPVSRSIRRAAGNPDKIKYPVKMLEKHYGSYSKVSASAEIARHMSPERNLSHSFRAFADAVRTLTNQA